MILCHPATGRAPLPAPHPMWSMGAAGEFGWSRRMRNGAPKFHRGVDLALEPGSPIFAGHDGVIDRTGEQAGGLGFGQRVYLRGLHGEQLLLTIYAHLSGQNVAIREEVRAGHLLGWSGMSGNITTELPHCHHEVRLGGVGRPDAVNPAWFYHGDGYAKMGVSRPGGV